MRATDPADAVTLIPETEDDLGIGLGLDDDGELVAAITVWTTEKGKYVIPLTAKQLGLLMSMSKTILEMDDATVARVKAAWQAEVDRRRSDG